MEKLLRAAFLSSFLLAILAAGDASFPPHSSLNRQGAQVLGRRGRELAFLGFHRRDGGKQMNHPEEAAAVATMEVGSVETKAGAGWTEPGEDAMEGLIDSEDYSGVAMHSRSPPMHKHPTP